ncbi:hypothetical protein RHSIM_Rhsim13G0210200 [Rhododendron simsii]|uniref:Uncharacterized protein n=1 Tax=Rhododendron simsii TaxID=118357 RepID=A0A834L6C1_RHOSS|nr:hypothetical protein RHSIM_Rhsim13G0210200 [Rhododendron simsii]
MKRKLMNNHLPLNTPSLTGEEGRLLLGKRSRTLSPTSEDDSDEVKLEEKSPCLLAHTPDGPVLYSIQFSPANYPEISTSWRHKKGSFCRRCCVDLFGSGDDKTQQLGLRELTPAKSKSKWTPDCSSIALALGSAVLGRAGSEVLICSMPGGLRALKPSPKGSNLDSNRDYLAIPPVACGGPFEEKKIVVARPMFIFLVNSQTWEELPSPKLRLFAHVTSNLVGVGNKLYWTEATSICLGHED